VLVGLLVGGLSLNAQTGSGVNKTIVHTLKKVGKKEKELEFYQKEINIEENEVSVKIKKVREYYASGGNNGPIQIDTDKPIATDDDEKDILEKRLSYINRTVKIMYDNEMKVARAKLSMQDSTILSLFIPATLPYLHKEAFFSGVFLEKDKNQSSWTDTLQIDLHHGAFITSYKLKSEDNDSRFIEVKGFFAPSPTYKLSTEIKQERGYDGGIDVEILIKKMVYEGEMQVKKDDFFIQKLVLKVTKETETALPLPGVASIIDKYSEEYKVIVENQMK